MVERHPYKVDVAGSNPVLPTKYLKSLSNLNLKKSKMVKTVGKMGQVLGLTKNNDQYEDVPDELPRSEFCRAKKYRTKNLRIKNLCDSAFLQTQA